MGYYTDKVVWVTGASSGIGEALTYAFSKAGAKLVISARRQEVLEQVKSKCVQPDKVLVLPMDMTDDSSFKGKVEKVYEHFGHVDVMVHNAGISQRALAVDTDFSVDKKLMQVNYLSVVALTKLLLPDMITRKSGQFIVITSLTGKFGSPLRSGYAGTKHALHGFFESLRAELIDDNIQVTLVSPGFVATNVSMNALTGDGSAQNKMDDSTAKGMPPNVAAEKILQAAENGKLEAYVGNKEILAIYIRRFFPRYFAKMIARAKVT